MTEVDFVSAETIKIVFYLNGFPSVLATNRSHTRKEHSEMNKDP